MKTSSTRRLIARLRWLRTLELLNMLFVPGVLVYLWIAVGAETWLLRSTAVALVAYILLQGGWYWHIKLAAVSSKRQLPGYFFPLFRFFDRSNVVLLVAYLVLLVVVGVRGDLDWRDWGWGIGLYLFAFLEYINYYHYQLMHDNAADLRYLFRNRRFRQAWLRRDLQAVIEY